MTSVKIKLNTQRITKKGYPIVIQIIHNRRKKTISTNYHVAEEEFDNNLSIVKSKSRSPKRRAQILSINLDLQQMQQRIEKAIKSLKSNYDTYSIFDILNNYTITENCKYFSTYCCTLISELKKQGNQSTAISYGSMMGKLQSFRGNHLLLLDEIDNKVVCDFERYLQNQGLKTNTINFHIRILKAIYNRAVAQGIIAESGNPFRGITLRTAKTPKRAINKDILRKIVNLDLSHEPHLDEARDIFLFSFYTRGMPFVDCAFLSGANIRGNLIEYSRQKTGQVLQIELNAQLTKLLSKYKNSSSHYILPILDPQSSISPYTQYRNALRKHNKRLHAIGQMVGVPLSSYVSRHSWATIAKHSGIPLSVISEGLGHTSEKTTYSYLSSFETSVLSKANDIVVNLGL